MADQNESPEAQEMAAAQDPAAQKNAQLLSLLHRLFGAETFTDVEEPYGLLTATTTRERIHDIIAGLQQDQELQLNFLTTMCGMHFPSGRARSWAWCTTCTA
ncbi:hypothetical protein [Hymenobacter sp. 5516J-16]|uniref:hypothetical protein n=1 Tax=Hymenobacter sp. 5516J-16 TaxID=2932253 RepID=UPI00397A6651